MVKVEVFDVKELTTEKVDNFEEFAKRQAIMEKHKLIGQESLINKETKEDFPYLLMNSEERAVYGLLCPEQTGVEEFGDTLLPIRILELIDKIKTNFPNVKLRVWHKSSPQVKDPILVAKMDKPGDWHDYFYIVARWGEELEPYTTLFEKAVRVMTANIKDATNDLITKVELLKKDPEAAALRKLRAGDNTNPDFRF